MEKNSQEKILVVGGAGYIGSHMVRCLKDNGLIPVVLDNLSSGNAQAVGDAELIVGDLGDKNLLDKIFSKHQFSGVMLFASFIQVGESVVNPQIYYENNVARTITLLNSIVKHKIQNIIFSSTAAIFGNPEYVPIDEKHPKNPINPYGRSKLIVEQILADYNQAYGLRFGCLRYFNAAGAQDDGSIGECHEPETHLIPLILQAAAGRRAKITVFGDDYNTKDGTCVRDYIHVMDLADAHLLALRKLQAGLNHAHFNLGTGTGYTVMEVIETTRKVTRKPIEVEISARRAGDPESLIADGSAARKELGWNPKISDLETIIKHAWGWEQKFNNRWG